MKHPRYLKGELSFKILGKIEELIFGPKKLSPKDLFEEFFKDFEDKRHIQKILSKLKKEGLIEVNDKRFFNLTARGKNRLESLREKPINNYPQTDYQLSSDNKIKIIIFDIPKSVDKKRFWLRSALKNLNFKLLQKSVWIGDSIIPEDFIIDLKKLNLLKHIHIFIVKKFGTLDMVIDN